ncbi:hypothetical protein FW755_12490 [Lonepinella koalarum]|uniref:hypothetical protein n=1 Tax=Lonepinella koalarum TaxID=53417 RepID=UPI0011E3D1C9|nr:hypothetical protein [Lonepinella koalarum]TYG33316.1 hypothetical protein FW755_12490 [Lonepinella koalarum]
MANITLKDITPRHFYEAVKLLKMTEYRMYINVDSLEIRFPISHLETREETQKRFDQLEHLKAFLEQLTHSDVPTDWDSFIDVYRYQSRVKFYKK